MIVLGIDPGTAVTGCGVICEEGSRFVVLGYTAVRTSADEAVEARLLHIFQSISDLIEDYSPDRVAVEQLFFNRNVRSALAVGQARGVCLLAAASAGLPVYEYTPLQVKQAVAGYGRASKHQVQQMVKTLLGLEEIPRPDDAADALAAALCCLQSSRFTDRVNRFSGDAT